MTKSFCVTLSSAKGQDLFTFNYTRLRVFLVEFRQHDVVHFVVPLQLTHSDQGFDVVHRDEDCQRFRQPALAACGKALDLHPKCAPLNLTRDQLQHHDHVVALSTKRTVISQEDNRVAAWLWPLGVLGTLLSPCFGHFCINNVFSEDS